MNIDEFSIACKLINLKLRGFELPKVLPPVLISSLTSVGGTPTRTPTAMSPIETLPNLNRPMIPPQPVAAIPQAVVQPMSAVMSQQPLIPGMMSNNVPLVPASMVGGGTIPPMIPPQPIIPIQSMGGGPVAIQQQPPKMPVDAMNLVSPTLDTPMVLPALPGQTPPGSGTQSRTMSISEKAPSIESP